MEEVFSRWVEEMKGGTKISTLEVDLSPFLKVKGFEPVVSHLVSRVRPVKERQHIRNNLKHHRMRKHLALEKLTTEAQRKHADVESSLEEAMKNVSAEAEGLKRLVEREENILKEERELKSQIALLRMAREEREKKENDYKMWINMMKELIPRHQVPTSPSEESLRQEASNEDVQTALSKLKLLKQRSLIDKHEDFHQLKLGIWNYVESLVEKHAPSTLMKALTSTTLKEVLALDNATQQIDLAKDAKSLSLKYKESGEIIDELRPDGILETVDSMLVQMSTNHLKKHFENQRKQREIKCKMESLKSVTSSIETLAKENYDPEVVPEIMKYYELNLRVAGLQALPSTASNLNRSLESRANIAKKAKDLMVEKFNSIHNFGEKVKARNIELKSMVVGGFHSLEYLEGEKREISSIVKESLTSLVLPTPYTKGEFSREVEVFSSRLPSLTLRVFNTENGFEARLPRSLAETPDCYLEDLEELGLVIPFVTSWENIIDAIRLKKFQLKTQDAVISDVMDVLKITNNSESSRTVNEVKALCQKAKSHDVESENEITQVLKLCEETNVQMALELNKLKVEIDEWWNQPGDVLKEYLSKKGLYNK